MTLEKLGEPSRKSIAINCWSISSLADGVTSKCSGFDDVAKIFKYISAYFCRKNLKFKLVEKK